MRSRRYQFVSGLVAMALVVAACGSDGTDVVAAPAEVFEVPAATAVPESSEATSEESASQVLDSGATLDSFEFDGVTVHTYTNPEAGFGNTTAVIESENVVVLIDAHFGEASASEFRTFAESFGKPIVGRVVPHDRPDHIGGIEPVFGDIASYSSMGVVEGAEAAGTTITNELNAGEVTIDGITYRFDVFADAEAAEQVVISLPDHGVIAGGDLVYNGYHAVMTPTFENWLSILDELADRDGVTLVVPGHGSPGGPEAFDDIIDYLGTAQTVYADSDDAESFNTAMVAAFPDRPGQALLDFGAGRLFPKAG